MKTLLKDIVIPAGTVFHKGAATTEDGEFRCVGVDPAQFCDGDVLATMVSAADPHSVMRFSGIPLEAALRHAFKEIDRLAYELMRREGADKMLQEATEKEEKVASSVRSACEMCLKVAEVVERPRLGMPNERELARQIRQEIEVRFPQ